MALINFRRNIANVSSNFLNKISALNPFTISKKGANAKAYFALATVAILWGTTWVASKEGVKQVPGLELAAIRQLIAGTCYVLFFLAKGIRLPNKNEWKLIIVLSFLNFMMSNGLSTWGVKYISAGLGSIIGSIFPLWIVVIGLFTAKNKLPRKAIYGLLLGFAGICIVFYNYILDFFIPDFRFGIFLSLIATWTWAIGTIYTKEKAKIFNPYYSLGWQMLISGVVLMITLYATNTALPITEISWHSWGVILYLTFFGSFIAFVAFLYALQHLPTNLVSVYAYINPIVAVLLGSLLYGEAITIYIIIGGAVTLYGVAIVNKSFKRATTVEQPEPEGV